MSPGKLEVDSSLPGCCCLTLPFVQALGQLESVWATWPLPLSPEGPCYSLTNQTL